MHSNWSDFSDSHSTSKNNKHLKIVKNDMDVTSMSGKQIKSDLFYALFPIYYLSKGCGLLPIQFQQKSPGKYIGRPQCIAVFYNFFLLAALLSAEIWGLYRDLKDGVSKSTRFKNRTAVVVTCTDVLSIMVLTIISISGSVFRWKNLQIVVNKLIEIDEKLGVVNPKKTRTFSILLGVCPLVYLITLSCLDIYIWDSQSKISNKMDDKGPINYVPLYFMYIVIIVMEIQYAICIFNIGQRFVRLNKCLEDILNTGSITDYFRKDLGLAGDMRDQGQLTRFMGSNSTNFKTIRKSKIYGWNGTTNDVKNSVDVISELVSIHADLSDTVIFANKAFGMAVLAVTVTCLLHLIVTPYVLITEVNDKHEALFLMAQGLWIIFHMMRLFIVVQPAYAAVTTAKRTAVIVSQLLSSYPSVDVQRQLEIFSLQLLHRPLQFSACGLFALDRPLVTSIAGAVTTYLVILIQFQKADEDKGNADSKISEADSILKNATLILRNASSLHNFTYVKNN